MSSSQSCSHRDFVQNEPIESSTALMATLFVKNPKCDPDRKNVVITKLFAPEFCAEWSNREVHSSHGDHFRDYFCVYVSGTIFGKQKCLHSIIPPSGGPGRAPVGGQKCPIGHFCPVRPGGPGGGPGAGPPGHKNPQGPIT